MSNRVSQALKSREAATLEKNKNNRTKREQMNLARDYADMEHNAGPWLEIEPMRKRSSRSVKKNAAQKIRGALLKNRYLRNKSLKKAYENMEKENWLGGKKKCRKTRKSF